MARRTLFPLLLIALACPLGINPQGLWALCPPFTKPVEAFCPLPGGAVGCPLATNPDECFNPPEVVHVAVVLEKGFFACEAALPAKVQCLPTGPLRPCAREVVCQWDRVEKECRPTGRDFRHRMMPRMMEMPCPRGS